MPEWTDEQKKVIESRDQSLLVSAAAGSGKTAVLVERIMEKILDDDSPADIDRMLVVTFTNAAAASLREKIRCRLEDEAARKSGRRARTARRQLSLLSGDHIETIDRFCREIVLDHADELKIDPSFRIADEGELQLLQSEVVSQVIEESLGDSDLKLRELVEEFSRLYAPGRKEHQLDELILSFYRFSTSHEFPRMWRRACAGIYRMESGRGEWEDWLAGNISMQLSEIRESLHKGLDICLAMNGPYHLAGAMAEHAALLDTLTQCGSMKEWGDILGSFPWPRAGVKKRKAPAPYVDPVLEEQAKNIRKSARAALDRLAENYFFAPQDVIDDMRLKTAVYMDALVLLADRFEDRFSQEKRTRRIADFSDVAHWALTVLIETDEDGMPVFDTDGEYIKTRIASEYSEHFLEIYIDEYQDSNRVQEILLSSIARPESRFMVGDMKQSIYRFRMADTRIFREKADSYSEDEDAKERLIFLHRNFRSRKEILDCVNLIFHQIMRQEIGGVEYTADQELKPGYEFPDISVNDDGSGGSHDMFLPELILVEKGDAEHAHSASEAEAHIVASRISEIVGSMPLFDKDSGKMRPAGYKDITILLRTATGWAETFSRVLDEHGIPNRADASTGYFDAPEVRTILSYFRVLDNPRQDIPLAAVLVSPIGGLTDNELAVIRSGNTGTALYDCVLNYCEGGDDPQIRSKLAAFADMTRQLRALVSDTPIHLLLWEIYDRTGYEYRITVSKGGRQKAANLELLADMAMSYEQTSYRGLFHFVRYIEKLRKADRDTGQAADSGTDENLVRIMTMHKSKGLEFPIVFVSGLSKRFNMQDSQGTLVMHEGMGAGLDFRDAGRMGKMTSRMHRAVSERIRMDSIGEELRVLYVAMTRAEQKLIMTGCPVSRKQAVEKALSSRLVQELKLPAGSVTGASCMLDWILAALSRHGAEREFFDSGRWNGMQYSENRAAGLAGCVRIITGPAVSAAKVVRAVQAHGRLEKLLSCREDVIYDQRLHERLEHMLANGDKDAAAGSNIPGKLSVSQIKHEAYEKELKRMLGEEGALLLSDAAPGEADSSVPTPSFLKKDSAASSGGAAIGSVYHLILSEIDFSKENSEADIRAQLETMVNCDRIQKKEAGLTDPGRIVSFLESDLGLRMKRAAIGGRLWREQPFVTGRDASDIKPEWTGREQILIQGIIDAFFIEDDEIVLIDYKTDRAMPGDEESLVRRYRVQFRLYADALNRLLQKRVKEAWLYSLSLQEAIPVDISGS